MAVALLSTRLCSGGGLLAGAVGCGSRASVAGAHSAAHTRATWEVTPPKHLGLERRRHSRWRRVERDTCGSGVRAESPETRLPTRGTPRWPFQRVSGLGFAGLVLSRYAVISPPSSTL